MTNEDEIRVHIQYIREDLGEIKEKIKDICDCVLKHDKDITEMKVRSGLIAGLISAVVSVVALLVYIFTGRQ